MSDLASLLTAIGGLVTALGGAVAVVITAVRTSRKERPAAAEQAAQQIASAAEDGDYTVEEVTQILQALRRRGGGDAP